MNYTVYKIVNSCNSKIYIGQTTESLSMRLKRHLGYQSYNDTKFARAIRKLGRDKFSIVELESCADQSSLDIAELRHINSYSSESLYNSKFTIGKCGGDTLSGHPSYKDICNRISISKLKSNNPNSTKVRAMHESGIVKEYTSIKECQEDLNIARHDIISRRCREIIKCDYNGWMFEYYK